MNRPVTVSPERAVPRYTSYPTAPHFTPAVGADAYAAWLAALPAAASLSLYLHVPFCRQLCLYCGCHTKATLRDAPIAAYARTLAQEIARVGGIAGRHQVAHLHWGGGTPSILGCDGLARLTQVLADTFDLSAVREHAIEFDPRHLTAQLARTLAAMRVTRASFGVQDFTPQVQRAIGRVQPLRIVKQAVSLLREAGIERINLDLMYGLPHQTGADVRRTVIRAASLQPQRIAVFGYAHVPWFRPQQRLLPEAALPDAPERIVQAETAHSTLLELGYVPVGLDHYARPEDELAQAARLGRLRRNFQGYTTDDAAALIGIGASAIGRLPQGFVQNAADAAGYARAIAEGRLATVRGIAVTAQDRLRGRIIERLMCALTVDLAAELQDAGGAGNAGNADGACFGDALAALRPLAQQGLVQLEGSRIRVTDAGRPYLRLVASTFDAYLLQGKARHSVAV